MVSFPQTGACLCGAIAYRLTEDPVTLYVCHCTDCQTATGASFALSMIVSENTLQLERGRPGEYAVELPDGRVKRACFCSTRLWGRSSISGLAVLEPGTLDDTSWLVPVGHIWARSAQSWVVIPEDTIAFERQPEREEFLAFVRAWKAREQA